MIKTLSNIALENEEVSLTIVPNSNYKLEQLKYFNNLTNKEVSIIDNKFIIPESDITINATFISTNVVENPTTGDNIKTTIFMFVISLLGLIVSIHIKKKYMDTYK